MNNKLEGITWHAEGEANCYRLMRGGNWLATIRMNGELLVWDQEDILRAMLQGQQAAPVADPDCDRSACGDFSPGPCDNQDCPALRSNKAAPVGEREAFEKGYAQYAEMTLAEVQSLWDGDFYQDQGLRDAWYGFKAGAAHQRQQPTDAALDVMRKAGLSIDGDNAYKRDLLDSVIGALAFGKQRNTPPPAGHWLERFYEIGQAEADERDHLRDRLADLEAREVVMPDDLSELLAEIVDIHRRRGVVLTIHIEQIADMLARLNKGAGSHE